ncbi:hypothetical protein WG66_010404 [Moniliophthora roreri]|nr:hypothetical protein WG66_010404 [Moniliophthora roreri]
MSGQPMVMIFSDIVCSSHYENELSEAQAAYQSTLDTTQTLKAELGCDVDQAKKEHRELKELLDKAKQKLREWNGREFQSIRLEDLKKEYEAEKPASSKKKTIKLEHEIDLVHDCY